MIVRARSPSLKHLGARARQEAAVFVTTSHWKATAAGLPLVGESLTVVCIVEQVVS